MMCYWIVVFIDIRFFKKNLVKDGVLLNLIVFSLIEILNFFEYFHSSSSRFTKICTKLSSDPSATCPLKKLTPFMKKSDLPKQFTVSKVQYSNKDPSNSLLMLTRSYPITTRSITAPVLTTKTFLRIPELTD